jgi:hypothetical protein
MIFHPAILSLYLSSILITFLVVYSASCGIQMIRRWDIQSGSELQLALERKTYLISTLLSYAFGFQLLSLFFFVFTADHLHPLFVGAMCAAGSLYANHYGYLVLVFKMINFLVAGLWLLLNYADNRAYNYPLIRKKYGLLLILTPLILTEAILQANYFNRLSPNIITSCCGSLFSIDTGGIASDIAALPSVPMKIAFYCTMSLTLVSGLYYHWKGKGGYLFSAASALSFMVSILSILSFISLYFYELPTHHCPFCILQKEYGYIGYPLYLTLLVGTILGLGVGVLMPFKDINSLSEIVPPIQKKIALVAVILFFAFAVIVTCRIMTSDFIL